MHYLQGILVLSLVPRADTQPRKQRKTRELKYIENQSFINFAFSLVFIKIHFFYYFWLPFGYPKKLFLYLCNQI